VLLKLFLILSGTLFDCHPVLHNGFVPSLYGLIAHEILSCQFIRLFDVRIALINSLVQLTRQPLNIVRLILGASLADVDAEVLRLHELLVLAGFPGLG